MKNLITYILIAALAFILAAPVKADNGIVDIRLYAIRNASKNQAFSQSADLTIGEEAEFNLGIINTGTVTARDVQIHVYLPFGMRLVGNSLKVDGVTSSNNAVSNSGIPVGNLNSGEQRTLVFRAVPSSSMDGFYEIQGQVSGGNIGTITKFVTIDVTPKSITPTPTPTPSLTPTPTPIPSLTPTPSPTVSRSPAPSPSTTPTPTPIIKTKIVTKVVYVYAEKENLTIVKVGRNVSNEQEIPTKEISARPGDELEFSIQITSNSDKIIENLTITDILPEQLDYVFNSSRMSGQVISDQIFRDGFSLGNLGPRQSKTVSYRVRVLPENNFKNGETILKNTSSVKATNSNTTSDTATIFVKKDRQGLLGGTIALGGLGLTMLILLALLAALFLAFRIHEKKRLQPAPQL